jgi:hypothetical protein
MRKSAIPFLVLAGLAAMILPLTSACNDCDENGFPGSILPCNNRSNIRAKPVEPAGPVDLEADGEPEIEAAEPSADVLPSE